MKICFDKYDQMTEAIHEAENKCFDDGFRSALKVLCDAGLINEKTRKWVKVLFDDGRLHQYPSETGLYGKICRLLDIEWCEEAEG